jgi:hypothetical protein
MSACIAGVPLTSWYLSMQRPRHFWSPLLRLLPGLEMHILKQWSRTVWGVGGVREGGAGKKQTQSDSAHLGCANSVAGQGDGGVAWLEERSRH